MSISDKELQKQLGIQLAATVFVAFFGAVYERFSHEVYSSYMIYAFAVPLLMGVVPYTILRMKGKNPSRVFLNLWNSAIATLTVGSVFAGVLAIAGYTNDLVAVYPIVGCALALAAIASAFLQRWRSRKTAKNAMRET